MDFEKSIKKSLFDKNIESPVYNPKLVVNTQIKNIKDKIDELIRKSRKVDIAISYVVWSGLSLIYNDLKKYDKNSRIILTTEGFVTDCRSLRKLLELDMQVKLYIPNRKDDGFHLKTYKFETEYEDILLIGSSNISSRAFGLVHEMAIEVSSMKNGYIVEEYDNVFDSLWNSERSINLTNEYIDVYEVEYKKAFVIKEGSSGELFEKTNIQPNFMQERALEALESYRDLKKGLVIAATGTGKTYLSAFDVRNVRAKKVLFLVHNRLIITSAVAAYKKIFPNKIIVELDSSNVMNIDDYDYIFTTDKTAHSYLLNKVNCDYFNYIIYDEAHKIGLDTLYNDIIDYFKPDFTLGITATPERTENPLYLFETFDYSVPYEIRLLDAMDHELVCPFTYYGLNITDDLLNTNEKFNFTNLSEYIKKMIDEKGHYGSKLKGLVFCSNQEEAKKLSKALNDVGFNSQVVVSDTNNDRDEVECFIRSLQSDDEGSLELICAVNKFNEGVDIPNINTIIMLRNTTSSIIYLQQLGRGLRRTKDIHKYVTVYDLIGNSKNNYTISQVLTGNKTTDKRDLYYNVNTTFKEVSPFINVFMEEEVIDKIIKSISQDFLVSSQLKTKFKNELYRFKEIPSLLDMYTNPNFSEMELLQLLHKSFYSPFERYYVDKYNVAAESKVLIKFFNFIMQFVFRGYSSSTLKDYYRLLIGEEIENEILSRVLLETSNDPTIKLIPTAIKSEYYKKAYNNPKVFIQADNKIKLNNEIIVILKNLNAFELYQEHIELIEHLSNRHDYVMNTYDLVDKAEFLFNVNSNDCYMNAVGERIDHLNKVVYCMISITSKDSIYSNKIIDEETIIYGTQGTRTEEMSNKKVEKLFNENYKFYICANFPHLKYTNTTYFNLGSVMLNKILNHNVTETGTHFHHLEFKLDQKLPRELIDYIKIG